MQQLFVYFLFLSDMSSGTVDETFSPSFPTNSNEEEQAELEDESTDELDVLLTLLGFSSSGF